MHLVSPVPQKQMFSEIHQVSSPLFQLRMERNPVAENLFLEFQMMSTNSTCTIGLSSSELQMSFSYSDEANTLRSAPSITWHLHLLSNVLLSVVNQLHYVCMYVCVYIYKYKISCIGHYPSYNQVFHQIITLKKLSKNGRALIVIGIFCYHVLELTFFLDYLNKNSI